MLKGRYIILIEDDALMGSSLVQRLELEGAEVTWVKQAFRGIWAVRTPRRPVDAVICDIRLPDGSGEEVFNTVSQSVAPPPFIFITGQGDIDQAVRLLKAGNSDYMTKPFDMSAMLKRLAQMLHPHASLGLPSQTGISSLAKNVEASIYEFAKNDWPLLIRAERGLGKGSIAARIHKLSDRCAAPFIEINTHRENVSVTTLAAALEKVSEGTLFVNGVGHLDDACQNWLMESLSHSPFRLIASCGTRIEEKAAAGRFRSDLLYALIANEIVVPPLSQRPEDAVWLAGQMFTSLNEKREVPMLGISELALTAIRDHDWPGNGREMRSRLLRAMDAAIGGWVFPADVFPELNQDSVEVQTLSEARNLAERRQIIFALETTGGKIAEAAQLLKVSRTTLWEKMQKLDL